MKVFYTTSSDMSLNKTPHYKNSIKILKDLVGESNLHSPEKRKQINFDSEDDDLKSKAVSTIEKHLKDSDVAIADITDGKAGVGYFVSNALFLKKPTLVIQQKSKSMNEIHDSITAGKHRLLTYKTYENEEQLKEIMLKFLDKARKKLDTKFILIISPIIDRYLEWASSDKRMHKAQIVRNAIEDAMAKDKDWKKAQDMI